MPEAAGTAETPYNVNSDLILYCTVSGRCQVEIRKSYVVRTTQVPITPFSGTGGGDAAMLMTHGIEMRTNFLAATGLGAE